MHRQNQRRNAGGDPREICNLIPSREARDFSIPGASRARQAVRTKAPVEHRGERTPRCVSEARRPATHGWTEMASAL